MLDKAWVWSCGGVIGLVVHICAYKTSKIRLRIATETITYYSPPFIYYHTASKQNFTIYNPILSSSIIAS